MEVSKGSYRQIVSTSHGAFGMGDTLVNLGRLLDGNLVGPEDLRVSNEPADVSLVSLKFTSDNIDVAKQITTEGVPLDERENYVRNLSKYAGAEIFEFSTCNRVLYVGFGIEPEALNSKVCKYNNMEEISFDVYEGTDAWRKLVKICSGLDSFILGELQVMSQFRKSVNFHRDNGLISHYNSAFFEHVIAANRSVRKKLGFTQTTESMLSLATTSLELLLEEKGRVNAVVLGFGEMGSKAAEALISSGQTNIVVVSREPAISAQRHPDLADHCTFISYEEWNDNDMNIDLVISTIRNAEATYHAGHKLPVSSEAVLMDFAWPPSIDVSGAADGQQLMGMEHWIKMSRNLGKEWDYESTVDKSESMINTIQDRYKAALDNKTQGKFRAIIYATLEGMAKQWEDSQHASDNDVPQLGAFSREIATWICHQPPQFHLSQLSNFVANTERKLSPSILSHVDHEVKRSVLVLSEKGVSLGGAS